jgi:hypothetical protein
MPRPRPSAQTLRPAGSWDLLPIPNRHSPRPRTNIPCPLNPQPFPLTPAAKSTGPKTPEGKIISVRNLHNHTLISGTVVLKGESMRRFNQLAAALILHFNPRNPVETALVQTLTAARWRLLRVWGIQTAGFELEMARQDPSAGSGAVRAAVTFRHMADNSRALALQLRYEAAYDRQYNRALATLLKLRENPEPSAPLDPPIQLDTETWESDFLSKPISEANLGPTSELNRMDNE